MNNTSLTAEAKAICCRLFKFPITVRCPITDNPLDVEVSPEAPFVRKCTHFGYIYLHSPKNSIIRIVEEKSLNLICEYNTTLGHVKYVNPALQKGLKPEIEDGSEQSWAGDST